MNRFLISTCFLAAMIAVATSAAGQTLKTAPRTTGAATDHDAGFVRILAAGGGRIDCYHDPRHIRRLSDAGRLDQPTGPKCSFHVVEQLRFSQRVLKERPENLQ